MKLLSITTLCLLTLAGCTSNEPLTPEERRIESELKKDAQGQFEKSTMQKERERMERQF